MSRAGDIPLEPPLVRAPAVAPAAEDRTYLAYIGAALASALLGGFALAVWLPLAATDVVPGIERTAWLVQAHGWLQVQGWAGLFVAGMALRLVPRFVGRRPLPRTVTLPLLAVLIVPLGLRLAVLPWATGWAASAAAVATGVLSGAGCLGVGAALAVTLARGRRSEDAWRAFLVAGTAWWLAWGVLAAWWGWRAAGAEGLAPVAFDDALTWVVLFGAIGNFVIGIQARSVPVFFGRRPPSRAALAVPAVLLNVGTGLLVAAAVAGDGAAMARLEGVGLALAGVGLCWALPAAGAVRGRAHRLRPRARPAARYVLAANLAGVASGLLVVVAGIAAAWAGDLVAWGARDAARHLFGLGPVTMLILGMARLIAPVFAVERTESRPGGFLERAPFWLLLAALVIRPAAGLASEVVSYTAWMHAASLAGMLAWAAIALFGVTVVRAARNEGRNLAAIDALAGGARG